MTYMMYDIFILSLTELLSTYYLLHVNVQQQMLLFLDTCLNILGLKLLPLLC